MIRITVDEIEYHSYDGVIQVTEDFTHFNASILCNKNKRNLRNWLKLETTQESIIASENRVRRLTGDLKKFNLPLIFEEKDERVKGIYLSFLLTPSFILWFGIRNTTFETRAFMKAIGETYRQFTKKCKDNIYFRIHDNAVKRVKKFDVIFEKLMNDNKDKLHSVKKELILYSKKRITSRKVLKMSITHLQKVRKAIQQGNSC
jgi:hypothetical protein